MPDNASTLKLLNVIRVLAIADGLLLVVLVLNMAVLHVDALVAPVGAIHGVGFIGLLLLTARGAGEQRWGWWFPMVTLITTGPPGSLYGDWRVRRELAAAG